MRSWRWLAQHCSAKRSSSGPVTSLLFSEDATVRLQALQVLAEDARFSELQEAANRFLQDFPDHAKGWMYLGAARHGLGQQAPAFEALLAALQRAPGDVETGWRLGELLADMGDHPRAIALLEQVLGAEPHHLPALRRLFFLYRHAGNLSGALAAGILIVQLIPADDETWQQLDHLMEQIGPFPLPQAFGRFLIEQSPQVSCNRPGMTDTMARAAFLRSPPLAALRDKVLGNSVDALAGDVHGAGFLTVLHDPLLLNVLRYSVVASMAFERFTCALRYALLKHLAIGTDHPAGWCAAARPVLHALACYIFRTEYLPDVTAQEEAWVHELETPSCPSPGNEEIQALRCMTYAMYRPLNEFPASDAWQPHDMAAWPELADLYQRTCLDLREEVALRKVIPCLGEVEDRISRHVREQYEESPYPRWDSLPVTQTLKASRLLAETLPFAPPSEISVPDAPDILVAGCGTGNQPLSLAAHLPEARILAVDLSLSSLSYALRKARELGLDGRVTFAQADLLRLGQRDASFDVIECIGVLHHMQEPLEGWRVLTGLLRPGGVMKIGLYSHTARLPVRQAREEIARHGYGESLAEIRRFRREREQDFAQPFQRSLDFYTASGVRDLLFHRQEHQFTIPQIEECLQTLGLRFIGFTHSPVIYDAFRRHRPGRITYHNLPDWVEVERLEPSLFAGMYQFWCHRAA